MPYVTLATLTTRCGSAPLAIARRAKGPQPSNHVFLPSLGHFRILSVLGQRAVAFDHRDQKTSGVSGFDIAANPSMGLSFSQRRGNTLLPFQEHRLQPLAESLVNRRHFLSQIVQGTAFPHVLGPN